MLREARELIWGENFCFPPDWQKGRVVQNDMGGENAEKEGSNLRAARTQWVKVEGPPGGRMRTRIGAQWLWEGEGGGEGRRL